MKRKTWFLSIFICLLIASSWRATIWYDYRNTVYNLRMILSAWHEYRNIHSGQSPSSLQEVFLPQHVLPDTVLRSAFAHSPDAYAYSLCNKKDFRFDETFIAFKKDGVDGYAIKEDGSVDFVKNVQPR